ncbi:hypothetical protein [Micromonospora sp. WMMA1996]|uniref:hypothetical protein n=1 Tax=Micromonospora sp. WMMA1996 TaxID=2039878 RepID=UPI001145E31B|nr:hypothetical protein [Micromonospora sp. WMMA1996]
MQPDENARPQRGSWEAGEATAGEAVEQSVPQCSDVTPLLRGGDPVIRRRRDAYRLDDYLDAMGYRLTPADVLALTTPAPAPDVAPCGGAHSGPCDWWRSCTGMTLPAAERDAAGAVHPGRMAA